MPEAPGHVLLQQLPLELLGAGGHQDGVPPRRQHRHQIAQALPVPVPASTAWITASGRASASLPASRHCWKRAAPSSTVLCTSSAMRR
ncbi:MAG: hypothetical protein IPP58_12150 [Holophagaceae bacterium]|uniref:Uncharacterized protein n=1 Tax=Candidatus Geothrix skivensis TaxID=2954439 RepID=A0A9D7XM47_9BACT|nr:hypothetical protein [Candidatus Geothrix skivensis]